MPFAPPVQVRPPKLPAHLIRRVLPAHHVQELDDDTVVLKPRVLVSPTLLTVETLKKAEAGRDLEEFETAEELFQDLES